MTIDKKKQIVSVERAISATPEQIFELRTDPRNHSAFDGSGTVKAANLAAPTRLTLGAQFGMDMKMGHHVWRYMLEPVAGGTKVTEQFEYAKTRAKTVLYVLRSIPKNEKSMIKTLENLEKHFAGK